MVYVVAVLCAAEVLTMTGVSTFAALLPVLRDEWHASNTIAGLISGAFFGGYMVAVPLLVSLTDRIPARRVYLFACVALACGSGAFALARGPLTAMLAQALLGAGLAGTYMPGLKELSDRVSGPRKSRAIAFYTSTFGIGNSLSLWMAGVLHAHGGWRLAFEAATLGPLAAAAVVAIALRPTPFEPASISHAGLFRIVARDRAILGYVIGYAAHCWELFAVRSWLVAFLAFSAGGVRVAAPTIAALLNLLGPPASISGNEIAGGRRVGTVRVLMLIGAVLAFTTGLVARSGAGVVLVVLAAYVLAIMSDSAALTAGLIEASPPEARGTAMAVYSFFGFAGALMGPVTFGMLLDAGGGAASHGAWMLAFAGVSLVSVAGAVAVRRGVVDQ